MTSKNLITAVAVVALLAALGYAAQSLEQKAESQDRQAPMFEVDPFWPKPLPNHWILGSTIREITSTSFIAVTRLTSALKSAPPLTR